MASVRTSHHRETSTSIPAPTRPPHAPQLPPQLRRAAYGASGGGFNVEGTARPGSRRADRSVPHARWRCGRCAMRTGTGAVGTHRAESAKAAGTGSTGGSAPPCRRETPNAHVARLMFGSELWHCRRRSTQCSLHRFPGLAHREGHAHTRGMVRPLHRLHTATGGRCLPTPLALPPPLGPTIPRAVPCCVVCAGRGGGRSGRPLGSVVGRASSRFLRGHDGGAGRVVREHPGRNWKR